MIRSMLRPGLARQATGMPLKAFPARSFHVSAPSQKEEEKIDVGEGWIDKYKLYEPSRYVPITAGILGGLNAVGLYHFSNETQLLGLFFGFVFTVYGKAGDAIGKMIDEATDEMLKETNELENQLLESYKEVRKVHVEARDLYTDIIGMHEEQVELVKKLAEVQPHLTKLKTIQQVERLMAIYAAQENKIQFRTQTAVCEGATAAVKAAFESDPKLQAAALDSAFASLVDPSVAPKTDAVGDLYTQFFDQFRAAAFADRVANPTVAISKEVKEEAEGARKMIIASSTDIVDDADKVFPAVGDKYNFVSDGLEGVIFNENVKADPRFVAAQAENKKFMSAGDYKAWESAASKVVAKEI